MFFDIRWKSTVALNTIKRKIRARFPRWKKAPRNSSNEVRSNVDKFRKILERGNFYLGQSCERNLRLKNSHVPGIPADQTYKEIEAQFPRNFAVTEKGSRGERLKVRKLEIYKNQRIKISGCTDSYFPNQELSKPRSVQKFPRVRIKNLSQKKKEKKKWKRNTSAEKNRKARISRVLSTNSRCIQRERKRERESLRVEVSSADLVFSGVFRGREKKPWQTGGRSFAEIKRARFIPQPSGSFYSIRDATAEIADTPCGSSSSPSSL